MRRRVAGMTLGIVLMLVAVAVTAAFTLAGMAFSQLNFGNRSRNVQLARNAAESAIADTLDRMVSSRMRFGRDNETVEFEDPNDVIGVVTFVAGTKRAGIDIPISTHNWEEAGADGTVTGYGSRLVPKDAVHIVGTGISGDVVKTVECIVHFPNFTYSIASRGPITIRSSLVAGLRSAQIPRRADGSIDEDQLDAGSVVSNSTRTGAVGLDLGTRVTGDVQAPGTIQVTNGSIVLGEVRPSADEIRLPPIDIDRYDPSTSQFVQTLQPAVSDLRLEGYGLATTDLNVSGDLRLESGLVFVKGNLNVTGGIVGEGAVFVKGATRVAGASSLTGDEGIALVGEGDVVLSGTGKDRNFLQGLVYTKGRFRAERITLVGTFVQDRSEGDGGDTTIDNATVIHQPTKSAKYMFTPVDRAIGNGGKPHLRSDYMGDGVQGAFSTVEQHVNAREVQQANAAPEQQRQPQELQNEIFAPADPMTILNPPGLGGDELTEWCFKHMLFGVSVRKDDAGQRYMVLTLRLHGRGEGGQGEGNAPIARQLLPGSPWTGYPTSGVPEGFISILEYRGPNLDAKGRYSDAALREVCGVIAGQRALNIQYANEEFGLTNSVQGFEENMFNLVRLAMQKPDQSKEPAANFRYDPNDYLSLPDKMRVQLWREVQ